MMPAWHFRSLPGVATVDSKDETRPTAATLSLTTRRIAMTLAANALMPTAGHLGRAAMARLEAVPLAAPHLARPRRACTRQPDPPAHRLGMRPAAEPRRGPVG